MYCVCMHLFRYLSIECEENKERYIRVRRKFLENLFGVCGGIVCICTGVPYALYMCVCVRLYMIY